MALPPTIPTSFVPHPTSSMRERVSGRLSGVFSIAAYGILIVAVILAVCVFIYSQILSGEQSSKDAALAKAEAGIDPATVNTFVRLQDRLTSGARLLTNHIAFSGFFAALQTILPSTVRFTTLHLFVDQTNTFQLEGTGVAKSFNALAATSNAFAQDGRIKNAIFSNLSVNPDSSVGFSLTATLDPTLVGFNPLATSGTASSSAATTTSP